MYDRGRWVKRRGALRGLEYWTWGGAMPRLPKGLLDSVFYLYKTTNDALLGEANGGTGFLVIVQEGPESPEFVYAFSNWHVVGPPGEATVARINVIGGGYEVLDQLHWTQHPDGDDLAMARLELSSEFDVNGIRWTQCLDRKSVV